MADIDLEGSVGAGTVLDDAVAASSGDLLLAGNLPMGTGVQGGIFVSRTGDNTPQITVGNVKQYFGDLNQGGVTPGVNDHMPNSGTFLQPFLRGWVPVTNRYFGNSGNHVLDFTLPADVQVGDLIMMVGWNFLAAPPPTGWSQQYSAGGNVIWSHYVKAGEPGKTFTTFAFGSTYVEAVMGVWGNAQVGAVATNTTRSGATVSPPALPIHGGDALFSGAIPYKSYGDNNYNITWTPPTWGSHLTNANAVGYYYYPVVFDAYPATTGVLSPSLTAHGGSPVSWGSTFNFSVELHGTRIFPYAQINVEERTGTGSSDIEQFVHIIATDDHSPQSAYGYADGAMNDTNTGTLYTCERWIRVRFSPDFNAVSKFRFFAPNLTDLPPGWTVNFGTSSTFQTPVSTASSIATTPVPTSDPGRAAPNAGGTARLAGTGTQFSDWIVLQASADTAVVGPGPVLGFSTEGTLIPVEFCFVWTES